MTSTQCNFHWNFQKYSDKCTYSCCDALYTTVIITCLNVTLRATNRNRSTITIIRSYPIHADFKSSTTCGYKIIDTEYDLNKYYYNIIIYYIINKIILL